MLYLLAILPPLSVLGLGLAILGESPQARQGPTRVQETTREIGLGFVLSAILIAAGMALVTELLSAVGALTHSWVTLLWVASLAGIVVYGQVQGRMRRGGSLVMGSLRRLRRWDWVFVSCLGLLMLGLFVVAVRGAVSNFDSLNYHMSRVAHWTQNKSIGFYPTGILTQLVNPIWAEEAILHLRLLVENDQLSGLVQWGSMAGVLLCVSIISGELGAGRVGKFLALAFIASLPMGLMQASTTQNDYVVSFWLACVGTMVLVSSRRVLSRLELSCLGMALGLALLTKGTAYPLVVPFMPWFACSVWRRAGARALVAQGSWIAVWTVLLNAGYWLRNLAAFGGPLGPTGWVEQMTAGGYGLGSLSASLLTNVAMSFATPWQHVNDVVIRVVRAVLVPIDPRVSGFVLIWGWNHEDTAGQPFHWLLIFAAVAALFWVRPRLLNRDVWAFLLAVGLSFVLLSAVVHFDIYGIRYQLPVMAMAAPVVGLAGERALSNRVITLGVFLLLLVALPWVLFGWSRPLVALKAAREPFSIPCLPVLGCTMGSILFEPPSTALFSAYLDLRAPYEQMSSALTGGTCRDIGLRIDSHDPEYLLWWSLGAPESGFRLETIYAYPGLERFADPRFRPCAIICTICGEDRETLHGLPLAGVYGDARLFVGGGFVADPDG